MIKKAILLSIFLLFVFKQSNAQLISKEEIQPLFRLLVQQKWDSAFTEANFIIQKHPDDTTDYKQIARYAVILSAAGKVADKKLKHLDLREIIWPFIGKRLMMSGHPTSTDTNNIAFNTTHLKDNNSKIFAETTVKNRKEKTVLTFENFEFDQPFDIEEFNKTTTRCSGVLYKVEINPQQDDIWVVRLFMVEGEIWRIK